MGHRRIRIIFNLCIMASSIFTLAALPWLIILIHYFEAGLHFAIISNQGDRFWWNRLWHIEFFRLWAGVYLILLIAGVNPGTLLVGVLARLCVFPVRLNLLRDKEWFYLGKHGIDALVSWLPPTGRKSYFAMVIAAMITFAVLETVKAVSGVL